MEEVGSFDANTAVLNKWIHAGKGTRHIHDMDINYLRDLMVPGRSRWSLFLNKLKLLTICGGWRGKLDANDRNQSGK